MSASRIIIGDKDRLDNVHPGDVLREDFLIGSEIALDEVASGAGIDPERLTALVQSKIPVDADLDLRLARYFGISEGVFLGLQIDYDLEQFRRTHGEELGRIVPRAA